MSKTQSQQRGAAALRYADRHRSAQELNDNTIFNPALRIIPASPVAVIQRALNQIFVEELSRGGIPDGYKHPIASGPKREKDSWRNVDALVTNLLNLYLSKRETMAVPLTPARYFRTSLTRGFVDLLKLAEAQELLCFARGFVGRDSRGWPTRKLRRLFKGAMGEAPTTPDFYTFPEDLINLRITREEERKGKKVKIREDILREQWEVGLEPAIAEELATVEVCLRWFNLVYTEYEMTYLPEGDEQRRYLHPLLFARYTNNFQQHGRFYTARGGHQTLKKAERKTITFNDHPTVELDYSGLHPRLLYHLRGEDYPLDADPYGVVLDRMGFNSTQVFKDYPEIRNDLKILLLAAINAKARTFNEARNLADYRLFREHFNYTPDTQERADVENDCHKRAERWRELKLVDDPAAKWPRVGRLLRAFMDAHRPIQDDFFSGKGLDLMHYDSQIARWVMMEMMVSEKDECIPTLPVHDSFITFEVFRNRLRNAMKDIYKLALQRYTGKQKSFRIPVK